MSLLAEKLHSPPQLKPDLTSLELSSPHFWSTFNELGAPGPGVYQYQSRLMEQAVCSLGRCAA